MSERYRAGCTDQRADDDPFVVNGLLVRDAVRRPGRAATGRRYSHRSRTYSAAASSASPSVAWSDRSHLPGVHVRRGRPRPCLPSVRFVAIRSTVPSSHGLSRRRSSASTEMTVSEAAQTCRLRTCATGRSARGGMRRVPVRAVLGTAEATRGHFRSAEVASLCTHWNGQIGHGSEWSTRTDGSRGRRVDVERVRDVRVCSRLDERSAGHDVDADASRNFVSRFGIGDAHRRDMATGANAVTLVEPMPAPRLSPAAAVALLRILRSASDADRQSRACRVRSRRSQVAHSLLRMRRFAFYGRVSTEDQQDPAASRQWQLSRAEQLIEPAGGTVVEEFFDIGLSRSVPWKRRPAAASLLDSVQEPAPRVRRGRHRRAAARVLRQPVRPDVSGLRPLRDRSVGP